MVLTSSDKEYMNRKFKASTYESIYIYIYIKHFFNYIFAIISKVTVERQQEMMGKESDMNLDIVVHGHAVTSIHTTF